jgi:O-acetylhomoserine/O-acetylserine sulfhydrylase-like pyridoxal-dependent enzyme
MLLKLEIILLVQQILYGGTVSLFTHTLSKLGIEIRYADPKDPKNFEKKIDDKTRAFYGETLPNPYLRVFPIKEVSDIGRKYNIPLIMDNTAAPVICKPIRTWCCCSNSFINKIYWWSWNCYCRKYC